MHPCICASVQLCICASVHLYICASVHLRICASVHLCICESVHALLLASVHPLARCAARWMAFTLVTIISTTIIIITISITTPVVIIMLNALFKSGLALDCVLPEPFTAIIPTTLVTAGPNNGRCCFGMWKQKLHHCLHMYVGVFLCR